MNKSLLLSFVLLGVAISSIGLLENQNIFAQEQEEKENQTTTGLQTLETEFVTVQFPAGWEGEVSTDRFEAQDFAIKDLPNGIVIMGFDNKLDLPTDFPKKLYKNNKEKVYEGFVKGNINAFNDRGSAYKIESYDLGKIQIGGFPAYADLYKVKLSPTSEERGMLLTMVFYDDDNMKTYATLATAPVDIYDEVEPKIMQILNSITIKK